MIVHADNQPSNHVAWEEKAKRFGFSVVTVAQKNPHPRVRQVLRLTS